MLFMIISFIDKNVLGPLIALNDLWVQPPCTVYPGMPDSVGAGVIW